MLSMLQCRQKTVETKHKCTKCTVQYCLKCLNNRYGADEEKKVSDMAQNAVQRRILMFTQMSWCQLRCSDHALGLEHSLGWKQCPTDFPLQCLP